MKALAIDTSTSVASIAIVDEKGLLGEYSINDNKTHSQKLVPMLKELLENLRLTSEDIDVFAAITGPGSFTGLRIGVTTIKALAYAAKKPTVGITSLDALANATIIDENSFACPIMDARNNQVYTALYKNNNGVMVNTSGYMGVHISELVNKLEEKDGRVIFTGDAVGLHRDFLKIELGERCSFMPDYALQQMAAPAAQLALMYAKKGETMSSYELTPFYLRKSQAEREYEMKHAE